MLIQKEKKEREFYVQRTSLKFALSNIDRFILCNYSILTWNKIDAKVISVSTLTSIECKDIIQRSIVLKTKSRKCNATLLLDNLNNNQILE